MTDYKFVKNGRNLLRNLLDTNIRGNNSLIKGHNISKENRCEYII